MDEQPGSRNADLAAIGEGRGGDRRPQMRDRGGIVDIDPPGFHAENGRAAGGERVWEYGKIPVGVVSLDKRSNTAHTQEERGNADGRVITYKSIGSRTSNKFN